MMNLLPKNEKEVVRNEYRARVVVVVLFGLFFTLLLASFLLIPSYIIASLTKNEIETQKQQLESQQEENDTASMRGVIKKTNNRISVLGGETKSVSVTKEIVTPLVTERQSVRITRIQHRETADGESVQVSGTARDRNVLLEFVERLKQYPQFEDVHVPVSNFVSRADIEFSLEIRMNK